MGGDAEHLALGLDGGINYFLRGDGLIQIIDVRASLAEKALDDLLAEDVDIGGRHDDVHALQGLLLKTLDVADQLVTGVVDLGDDVVGHTGTRPRIALASFLPAPKLISSCSAPMAFSMAMT